jgi:hypothetical protein
MKMAMLKPICAIRSISRSAAFAALVVLASSTARAVKLELQMTPDNLQQTGFSMKVENRKDGTVAFTLSRDLSRAPSPGPDSDLQLRRSATLGVSNKSGTVVECDLAPQKKGEALIYEFVIAENCVSASNLSFKEIDDYKDEGRGHLLGGGTYYEFRLASFAKRSADESRQ